MQVWSVPGQRFQFTFSGHSNWVRSCCFSPDGRLAVSGSDDKTVRVWDVTTRQCLRVYDDHSGFVNTVAFHPDGTCVASAGTDNAIKVGCQSNKNLRIIYFTIMPMHRCRCLASCAASLCLPASMHCKQLIAVRLLYHTG